MQRDNENEILTKEAEENVDNLNGKMAKEVSVLLSCVRFQNTCIVTCQIILKWSVEMAENEMMTKKVDENVDFEQEKMTKEVNDNVELCRLRCLKNVQ